MDYARLNSAEGDPDSYRLSFLSAQSSAHNKDTSDRHTVPEPNIRPDRPSATAKSSALPPPLRYRRRSSYLLTIYVPLLILPWILTCVLDVRPITKSSYIDQIGRYSPEDMYDVRGWLTAVRVMNSIASLITVPIVSALLVQAAVVYTQRHRPGQTLNVRQAFALADKGWSDISILWESITKDGRGLRSQFLWLAAGMIFISVIQQPIQQLLVTTETKQVVTCKDSVYVESNISSCYGSGTYALVGYDPEPADLATTVQQGIVQAVSENIINVHSRDVQLYLWPEMFIADAEDGPKPMADTFYWYSSFNTTNSGYYVSALPNATVTGVLRQHAIRLNSSVHCEAAVRSAFPSSCPGRNPFVTSFSKELGLDIRVCVPGNYSSVPWTLSRDRQDITEEIFIDVFVPFTSLLRAGVIKGFANFTIHCTANTTRGYFELGNYQNNYTAGPLLNKWPSETVMETQFNDYLGREKNLTIPSSMENSTSSELVSLPDVIDPFGTWLLKTPGPLTISALSIFGNQTFFYTAATSSNSTFSGALAQLCRQGNLPFTQLYDNSMDYLFPCYNINSSYPQESKGSEKELLLVIYSWILAFRNLGHAEEALEAAMYFANEALLIGTASATSSTSARSIWTSPGLTILKPRKTLAGTTIISVLILLQLVGLILLARYACKVPTWTDSLDALAVARIGASLKDIPPVDQIDEPDLKKKLEELDALVGVAMLEEEEQRPETSNSVEGFGGGSDRLTYEDNISLVTIVVNDSATSASAAGLETRRERSTAPSDTYRLGLGAPGLISRQLARL